MKYSQRNVEGVDGVVAIDVKGKLTGGPEAETFRELFKNLVNEGKLKVIVNLKDVDWISSTGIGIMIRGYKTIKEAGGEFIMVNVGERTQQVFNVLRLQHIFQILKTEEEAVKQFRG